MVVGVSVSADVVLVRLARHGSVQDANAGQSVVWGRRSKEERSGAAAALGGGEDKAARGAGRRRCCGVAGKIDGERCSKWIEVVALLLKTRQGETTGLQTAGGK